MIYVDNGIGLDFRQLVLHIVVKSSRVTSGILRLRHFERQSLWSIDFIYYFYTSLWLTEFYHTNSVPSTKIIP